MKNKITYEERYIVHLEGKKVGEIHAIYSPAGNIQGYAYKPNGAEEYGRTFAFLLSCKRSLEMC